jgi:hypothetical protein
MLTSKMFGRPAGGGGVVVVVVVELEVVVVDPGVVVVDGVPVVMTSCGRFAVSREARRSTVVLAVVSAYAPVPIDESGMSTYPVRLTAADVPSVVPSAGAFDHVIDDSFHVFGTDRAVMAGTGVVVAYTRSVTAVTGPGRFEMSNLT